MRRTFVVRNNKLVEINRGQVPIRHPDRYLRLACEGTMAERQLEGYRMWESENGLKGVAHPPSVIKKVWETEIAKGQQR